MDIEQMALMIPILGIVLGVGIAIVAIVTSHREKLKRAELRHRERMSAIEKGLEMPPDNEPAPRRGSYLRSGLISLFIGIVLYFALLDLVGSDVALFGLLPAAIGIGSLISYFIEERKARTPPG
jgi:hypothetical protein